MKKLFLAVCMLCVSAYIMPTTAYAENLTFGVYFDEADAQPDKSRVPVKRPTASITEHTLYINDCNSCVLQLVQDNEVVYSIVITSDTAELPESLTGNYELQIVRGNVCFWTEIEL